MRPKVRGLDGIKMYTFYDIEHSFALNFMDVHGLNCLIYPYLLI
jgi:hypothetical protein